MASDLFFFFNDTATTEIYTLSLHDALPICRPLPRPGGRGSWRPASTPSRPRSEEHTSELQSQSNLVCRLLLEKKNHLTCQIRRTARVLTHELSSDTTIPARNSAALPSVTRI